MARTKKALKPDLEAEAASTPRNAIDSKSGGRAYFWNGEEFVSVTTVLQSVPKPQLQAWKERTIVNAAAKERERLALLSEAEVREYLSGLTGFKRDAAGGTGTSVHHYAEQIAKGLTKGPAPERAAAHIVHFRQFLDDFNPTFIESEATCYSRKWGYAGTADAVMEINGRLYWVDYKTSKSVWPEVGLQLSAYSHADFIGRKDGTEDVLPQSRRGLTLHLTADGYKLYVTRITDDIFEHFLSVKDVHDWVNDASKTAIGPQLEAS